MTIHEFGQENQRAILLLHPAGVMWDYFTELIPLLAGDYHLLVVAMPGYDEATGEDYTSVEQIAADLASWLRERHLADLDLVYGCSMGGAVAIRLLTEQLKVGGILGPTPTLGPSLLIRRAVLDGAITPYQLPWILTRFIALKDFLLVALGKFGGLGLLEKAFKTGSYSKEELQYVARVLRFMSYRSIWRCFDSCNNYKMPPLPLELPTTVQYWYGELEKKERRRDLDYARQAFPALTVREFPAKGHGALAPKFPAELAENLRAFLAE